jgi:succinyl-CoA synthetase beta subunit
VAGNRAEAERHSEAILGMEIRGFTVHELYVEQASEIDEECGGDPGRAGLEHGERV